MYSHARMCRMQSYIASSRYCVCLIGLQIVRCESWDWHSLGVRTFLMIVISWLAVVTDRVVSWRQLIFDVIMWGLCWTKWHGAEFFASISVSPAGLVFPLPSTGVGTNRPNNGQRTNWTLPHHTVRRHKLIDSTNNIEPTVRSSTPLMLLIL
jgi:hypothetical protein